MADIEIRRSHHLGHDEARKTAEEIADSLRERLQAKYHWDGDHLRFSRSGADGHIRVSDSEVEVVIKLGLMLRPMKGVIQGKIEEYLDKKLG